MSEFINDPAIELYGFNESNFLVVNTHLMHGSVLHKQRFVEVLVVFEGKAMQTINEYELPMRMGDIFIMPPNVLHNITLEPTCRCCCIIFTLDFIKDNTALVRLPLVSAFFEPNELYAKGYLQFNVSESQLSVLQTLTSLLYYEAIHFSKIDNVTKNNLLGGFFAYLTRCYELIPLMEKIASRGLTSAAIYIESNFTKDIDINQLAAQAFLSRRQFDRLFIETYGITPSQYILTLRLKRANALLQDLSMPISAIAEQCGYVDSSHFSKHFKRIHGCSPLQYRKQYLESC